MHPLILLSLVTLGVCKLSASQLELNQLGVVQRLNTAYYDFYYACSTCSYSIQWRLNNQSAGTHDVDSPVGEFVSSPDASGTRLSYSSILMSSRTVNNRNSCLEAMLVVTRPLLEQVQVTCRGDQAQKSLNSVGDVQPVEISSVRGGIELQYVLFWSDAIQLSTVAFNTYVFVCSSALSLTWRINDISSGGFNGPSQIGDTVYELFSDYPQVLYRGAVLSTKSTSSELTSVLLISTTNTTSNMTITCRGLQHSIDLQVILNDELERHTTTKLVYPTSPLIITYQTSSSIGMPSCVKFIISIIVMTTVIWISQN